MTHRFNTLLKHLGRSAAALLALLCVAAHPGVALAEKPPKEIRFGGPNAFQTADSVWGWGLLGVAHAKGWLTEEFRNDGTTLRFLKLNTVPMVGEALAGNRIDFAGQGDLISILGRAGGSRTRYILPASKFENAFLVAATNSSIKSVADLRGKRVAYTKGNYIHLQVIRILDLHGLTEKDIRQTNLDGANGVTALNTDDVDAVFGGRELLAARDKGLARVVYSTLGQNPKASAQTGLIVREDFAARYPETTARVVKVLVRAAQWASDPANREQVFVPWSYSNQPYMQENYGDRPWSERASPLIDDFIVSQYQDTLRRAGELKLLRGKPFDLAQWMDRSFLDRALRELKLEDHWIPLDAEGRPLRAAAGGR